MKLFVAKCLMWVFYLIRCSIWLQFIKIINNYELTLLNDPAAMRKHLRYWNKDSNFKNVKIRNSNFTVNINDHIGYRIYMSGSFDEAPIYIAKKLNINSEDILLDIGANIGSVCIPIANETNCEVFAVEASSSVAFQLLQNVSKNPIKFSLLHGAAVSHEYPKEEYLKLYVRPGNIGGNSLFQTWNAIPGAPENIEYAKPVTIDDLSNVIEFDRIKLIKIDVEGAELEVLNGMNNLLTRGIPIMFEHRIDMLKKHRSQDGSSIIDILSKNYEVLGLEENELGEWVAKPLEISKPYANALAVSKDFDLKKLNLI